MKKIIILSAVTLSLAWGNNEELIKEIDQVVSVISQPRVTIEETKIDQVEDPFVRMSGEGTDKTVTTQSKSAVPAYKRIRFNLDAIVNSKAKINGSWVKKGEKIRGFTLSETGMNYVKLTYYNYSKILYLNKSENSIISKGSSDEK